MTDETEKLDELLEEEQQESSLSERPDWLPENFDSPEKLAKAYADQRRYITRLEEERKRHEDALLQLAEEMEKLKQERERAPAQEPAYNPEQDPFIQQYENALLEGDARALLGLNVFLAQQAAEQAINKALAEKPSQTTEKGVSDEIYAMLVEQRARELVGDSWEEVREDLGKLIEERPSLAPPETASIEESAQHLAFLAQRLVGNSPKASSQREETDISQAKRIARTLRGAGVRVQPVDISEAKKDLWESIKAAQLGTWSEATKPSRSS